MQRASSCGHEIFRSLLSKSERRKLLTLHSKIGNIQPIAMGSTSRPAVSAVPSKMDAPAAELWQRSGAEKFGLTQSDFARVLAAIARKYLPPEHGAGELRELCRSLKAEELALAQACAAGNELAWETFLLRYREKLYEMALSIAREQATARELADSIYADLYGTSTRDGQRVSKLASYTGRGSLEGWLRTVLAQEFVNRYRRGKRLVSLEEESEKGQQFTARPVETPVVVDLRLEQSIDEALAAISPEERFILSSYFLDERTLAEIARSLRLHESTISRKLDRITEAVRKAIKAGLRRRGMTHRQAEEVFSEIDVRDLQVNLRGRLTQESKVSTFSSKGIREAGLPESEPESH